VGPRAHLGLIKRIIPMFSFLLRYFGLVQIPHETTEKEHSSVLVYKSV